MFKEDLKTNALARALRAYFCLVIVLILATMLGASSPAKAAYNDSRCSFSKENAICGECVMLDVSHSSDGYVGVKNDCDEDIVIIFETKKECTIFPAENGISYFIFPFGSGKYNVSVCKRIEIGRFETLVSAETAASISEKTFLLPTDCMEFNVPDKTKHCVEKAREIRKASHTDKQFVRNTAKYLFTNLTYDQAAAALAKYDVASHVIPDDVLKSGKGICKNYAITFAAMCRSQDIPCKVVYGDLKYKNTREYHAWNEAFVNGQWISVDCTNGQLVSEMGSSVSYIPESAY